MTKQLNGFKAALNAIAKESFDYTQFMKKSGKTEEEIKERLVQYYFDTWNKTQGLFYAASEILNQKEYDALYEYKVTLKFY